MFLAYTFLLTKHFEGLYSIGIGLANGEYMETERQIFDDKDDELTMRYCARGKAANETAAYLIPFTVETDKVFSGKWNLTAKIVEGLCCSLSLLLAVSVPH